MQAQHLILAVPPAVAAHQGGPVFSRADMAAVRAVVAGFSVMTVSSHIQHVYQIQNVLMSFHSQALDPAPHNRQLLCLATHASGDRKGHSDFGLFGDASTKRFWSISLRRLTQRLSSASFICLIQIYHLLERDHVMIRVNVLQYDAASPASPGPNAPLPWVRAALEHLVPSTSQGSQPTTSDGCGATLCPA